MPRSIASDDGRPAEGGDALAVTLEQLAYEAWQAEEVVACDGWRLRAMGGVTNRANSAWTGAAGALDFEARMARTEAFYAERGLPPKLQVSPVARPQGLDARLEARGYRLHSPVCIQTADASDVAGLAVPDGITTEVHEQLTEAWFAISGHQGRFAGEAIARYRALLGRARERPVFALARAKDEPVAVGLGVAGAGWLGIFAMLTLSASRGRGAGRAVLSGLARWAAAHGCARLYLQVESSNAGARRLYERAGFATRYRYHYRTRD